MSELVPIASGHQALIDQRRSGKPVSSRTGRLATADSGPKTLKVKDTARRMIMDHWEGWYEREKLHYQTKRKALKIYCELYRLRKLNLSPQVYAKVKKVGISTLQRWFKEAKTEIQVSDNSLPNGSFDLDMNNVLMPFNTSLTGDQQRVVLSMFLNQGQLGIKTIVDYINDLGTLGQVTYSATRRFLDNFEQYNKDIVSMGRHGPKHYYNNIRGWIGRDWNLLDPDELWIADGHKLDIMFYNPVTGKPYRAVLVLYMDAASRRGCGFALHWTETTDSALQALASGMVFSGVPQMILFDNGTAFKNERMLGVELDTLRIGGVLDEFGIKPIWSIPGNPRSKPVERFFRTLKDQFSRMWPTFTGGAPQWRPENLDIAVKEGNLPTIGEVLPLLVSWLDKYNNTPHTGLPYSRPDHRHLTPNEVYHQVKHLTLQIDDIRSCMRKAYTCKIRRNGVKINKTWYTNFKWVPKFVGNGRTYLAYINDFDPSQVDIYDKDNYLFTCWPIDDVHPLAQLSDEGRKQLSERMELLGVSSKETKNSLAQINKHLPAEMNINQLIKTTDPQLLQDRLDFNDQPVEEDQEALERDEHQVDWDY